VVDDGSRDGTGRIAANVGCEVIRHPVNRGKGMALRAGFEAALAQKASFVITLDADGQHDPEHLPALWSTMIEGGWDIVIGARRRGGQMPIGRRLSNMLNSLIVSGFTGQRIPDSQSGFRLIKAGVLEAVRMRSVRYELETELLLLAAAAGFRIGSVTIPTIYAGEESHIRSSDALRFVWLYWTKLLSN